MVPVGREFKAFSKEFIPLISRNIFTDNTEGSIMHAVQMSRLYPDSKTFVDMSLKRSPELIKKSFEELLNNKNGFQPITLDEIRSFVDENFETNVELEPYTPEDWKDSPKILSDISDLRYASFASQLNDRWKLLCRKISDDVAKNPEKYSLLYLPHPVIVPGGRFREVYYWDTYWIVIGLLHCEMFDTVKGLLLNFIHLIKNHGMIPNGGRSYYLNRSQPPLFAQMVKKYVDATGDVEFLKDNLEHVETEFLYWYNKHMVTFFANSKYYKMAHYNCFADGPRPESYLEDFELAYLKRGSEEDRQRIYHEIKAAAETGWDFSSRWFIPGDDEYEQLRSTRTSSIIPVDLNCFVERNARILAEFYANLSTEKQKIYTDIADQIRDGVSEVLWNEDAGVWLDYNYISGTQRNTYWLSNLIPLWTETFREDDKNSKVSRVVDYIRDEKLESFSGGLPATKTQTGQQWDFPNCWPPLQHMIVDGLQKSGHIEAQTLAQGFAEKTIRSCYVNFVARGHMYEKYDATNPMLVGGGGEYSVQLGFGWTNGVVLDFLATYGKTVVAPEHV